MRSTNVRATTEYRGRPGRGTRPPSRARTRALFAGLRDVAWAERRVYAYAAGGRSDGSVLPRLLRVLGGLRGSDRRRRDAYNELEWRLEHQGGVSDAAVDAIPFVCAILRERPGRAWQRRALLSLLALLAVPQPGNLFPAVVDPERDYRAADPRCFHACVDLDLARRCFEAVERELETIVRFVHDPSARVAVEAIGLCALFRRRAELTLPALRAPHADEACAAVALIADAMLAGGQHGAVFRTTLAEGSPVLRAAAACALAIATPHEMTAAALAAMSAVAVVPMPFAFGGDWLDVARACLERLVDDSP